MTATAIQSKAWGNLETTYDTVLAMASTNAVDFVSFDITPELSFEALQSHVGTASLQGEVEGMQGGKWSLAVEISTKGAGVAPDYGFLLEAAFGTETVSASTSVTYSCDDTNAKSLQLVKCSGDNLYEVINGAWVEQVDWKIEAGKPGMITFSGGFATYGHYFGGSTVDGAHSTSDTTIDVLTGTGVHYRPNALIKFGTEDNSGAGYTVVSVSADSVTITPGLAAGISDLDAVTAMQISHAPAGTVRPGINCGYSVGGTAIGVIESNVSFKTAIRPLDKQATSDRPTGLVVGQRREITCDDQVYFLDENGKYLGAAWNGTVQNIIRRAGVNTAAERMKLNTPACRLNVVPIELADSEVGTAKLSGLARQNSAAGDEFTCVLD